MILEIVIDLRFRSRLSKVGVASVEFGEVRRYSGFDYISLRVEAYSLMANCPK